MRGCSVKRSCHEGVSALFAPIAKDGTARREFLGVGGWNIRSMNTLADKTSPHFRFYGQNISIHGSKLESAPPSKEALKLIEELEEYVKHDDGANGTELCTKLHDGKVCRKLEGHD